MKSKMKIALCLLIFSAFICACGAEQADTTVQGETVQKEVMDTVEEDTPEIEVMEQSAEEVEEIIVDEPEEKPLENELIMNTEPIEEFARNLNEETIHYIIYNDVEGYKQILNDGETYHFKKNDKMFFYRPMGVIEYCKVLTVDVPARIQNEINMVNGWDHEIAWDLLGEDVKVVTFGNELKNEEDAEPMSITCTFYKYVE